jgi:hypothetical protein
MNEPTFTPERSDAMRTAVVRQVKLAASPGNGRAHRLLRGITTTGAGLLVLGGGLTAASAAGLIDWPFVQQNPLPGGDRGTVLPAESGGAHGADPTGAVILERTGAGSVELPLPDPPSEATHVSVQITCLTAGDIFFGTDPVNNPGVGCAQSDVPNAAWYDFPADGGDTLYVISDADVRWEVSAVYLTKETTEWAVNDNGHTYGVANDSGTPDLVAVTTSHGQDGYAYADELAEADGTAAAETFDSPEDALRWQEERKGKTITVRVYKSDGETLIGEHVIQN